MIAQKLTIYKSLDLYKLTIPQRNSLYFVEPLGLGTPYVESLTSYIARLAEVHCVPTGILVLSEIAPSIKAGYVFDGSKDGGLDKIFANYTQSLNGMGNWTAGLIRVLESLTLCKDLRFLTMLSWAKVIPQKNLLRPIRAWCPFCYDDWRTAEQRLYEPLLWCFNATTVCPHHYCPLNTYCPHCNKTNRVLAWRSRPGYCSKCGKWLGACCNTKLVNNPLTEYELTLQTKIANNIGDLLVAMPRLLFVSPKGNIGKKLLAYATSVCKGNLAEFSRLLGMDNSQMCRWCKGSSVPQLSTLLHICDFLGISLVNFLTEEAISENFSTFVMEYRTQSQCKKNQLQPKRITGHRIIHNSQQVQHVLRDALNEFPPRSLTEVAQSMGYKGCSSLFYHASDLCYAVSARYAEYQKTERLEKMRRALEAMINAQEYPPPSMQEVAKRLGTHELVLRQHYPDFCNAISEKRASYRKELQTKRIQQLYQEVRQVACKLDAKGIEPTASRISEYLSKPGSILQKEAVAAVHQVRRELGWET